MKKYTAQVLLPLLFSLIVSMVLIIAFSLVGGNSIGSSIQIGFGGMVAGAGLPALLSVIIISVLYKIYKYSPIQILISHALIVLGSGVLWTVIAISVFSPSAGGWGDLAAIIIGAFSAVFFISNLAVEIVYYTLRRKRVLKAV